MKDKQGRQLPYFGIPPTREPMRAWDVPALPGKRVILSRPWGFLYDVRAVSRIYEDVEGHAVVDVVTERDYYDWMVSGNRPTPQAYPSYLVWVE